MVSIFCFVSYFGLITPWESCLQLKINIFYKFSVSFQLHTWRRHRMEQFPCHWPFVWGTPVTGEFPSPRPVMRVVDVLFDLRLNKRLSKQSRRRWFETPSRSLWPHCNDWQIVNLQFHTMFCLWWRGMPHPYAPSGDRAINTLRPRQNGRHFPDDIFKCIFFNENVWIAIKISLKFVPKGPINNIPALVQIMAWRRPDDKPLSEPMMVSLPTHICVTRPQCVKDWKLFIRPILTWRLGTKDSATTVAVCWKNSKHRSKSLYYVYLYISIYIKYCIFEYALRNSMCFIKCINYEFMRRTAYPCVTRAM